MYSVRCTAYTVLWCCLVHVFACWIAEHMKTVLRVHSWVDCNSGLAKTVGFSSDAARCRVMGGSCCGVDIQACRGQQRKVSSKKSSGLGGAFPGLDCSAVCRKSRLLMYARASSHQRVSPVAR